MSALLDRIEQLEAKPFGTTLAALQEAEKALRAASARLQFTDSGTETFQRCDEARATIRAEIATLTTRDGGNQQKDSKDA